VFEVLSTNGDTYLGGDDLDRAIIEYWMGLMKLDASEDQKIIKQQLRLSAEEAKIALSNALHFETNFAGEKLSITKEIFESLITPIVNKTMECCAKAMKDAGLKVADINTVLMVGGSTRVPLVKNTVSKYFNQVVNDSVNPDEVVALGAAVQADILAGNNQSMLLLDITPLSLGIETMGGLMDVLLPRNSKIPTQAGRQYTTQKDGQSGIQIAIYQGERDLVKDNRKLGEFTLSGIPSMPAGLPKVDVQFLINADGILQVRAKELRTGLTQSIDIKPQYGLTDAEVEQRLMDSITYAKEDIATRALVEAKTEAEQILSVTEKFMSKNVSLLSKEELMQTAEAMQALQLAITMEDKNLIQGKTEALNELTRPFAERVMDQAISGALKGKGIMD
jgi:molecular chaperone HscA